MHNQQFNSYDKKGSPAPQGYVAGFGRGAVGFITRSDIGDYYFMSLQFKIAYFKSGPSRLTPEMPQNLFGEQPNK